MKFDLSALKSLTREDVMSRQSAMLAAWVVSALIAIFVPLHNINSGKATYYNYYGKQVEYEQNQRAYEEAQNGGNQQQNNNQNNQYGYSSCSWFNFICRNEQYKYMQYNQNGEGNNQILPGWYFFLGGKSEEDQRQAEEAGLVNNMNSSSVNFVHIWSTILFIALVCYGCFAIWKRQSKVGLITAMVVFAQFALMNMLLIVNGVISSDDRDMEESIYGWYGQRSVLMALTDLWYVLFCVTFSIVFGGLMYHEHRQNKGKDQDAPVEDGYQKYEAPEVKVSSDKQDIL